MPQDDDSMAMCLIHCLSKSGACVPESQALTIICPTGASTNSEHAHIPFVECLAEIRPSWTDYDYTFGH